MSRLRKITVNSYKLSDGKSYDFELSFQFFGRSPYNSPVVLVNHALTGNSEVTGPHGWWSEIVGKEKIINLNQYAVIAFDIPGNGFGQKPVRLQVDYRLIDVQTVADLYWKSLDKLGINRLFAVIGGSLGGSIAWEMAVQRPDSIDHLLPVACNLMASDWLIGNVIVQEEILKNSESPVETARKHALLLYRTPQSLKLKFKNRINEIGNKYAVESWLNHHGASLKNRFSKESYLLVNHLLKTIGQNLTEEKVLAFASETRTKIHLIAIDSDYMFTKEEQLDLYRLIRRKKYDISYYEIESVHGHDAFLIEYEQLKGLLRNVFEPKIRIKNSNGSGFSFYHSSSATIQKTSFGKLRRLFNTAV